jgi:hypothetical protein
MAGTTYTNGITGESYIGPDYRMTYTTLTGSVGEGTVVTGLTSNATGTVVSHDTTAKLVVLRNCRGTFTNGETVQRVSGNNISAVIPSTITPIGAAPFGTFAGGKWFCGPGVVLVNFLSTDINSFQLQDSYGATVNAPIKVNVSVGNTRLGDYIALFRLTGSGGTINKAEYSATVQTAGATTLIAGSAITTDTPGKSTGGAVRLVDVSAGEEYRIRYASWTSATFTLASSTGLTATAGTSATHLASTGNFTTARVGDLIRNTTHAGTSKIVTVTSADAVEIYPGITGQVSGDAFEVNTLPVTTAGTDKIYVPLIDAYETVGSDGSPGNEMVNVTYLSDMYTLARVRKAGSILPFEAPGTIGSTGLTISTIRTPDTIYSA